MRITPITIIIALLIMITGCSSAPPPRTPGMSALGVDITTAALRQKIYQFESVFAATIHRAADEIIMNETERETREMAIRWKINSVPTMQTAVFQLDPLAGMADAWGLTAQMDEYFTSGNGKALFGDSQHIAVEASQNLRAEVRALAHSIVGDEKIRAIEPRLEEWLHENPILDISFGRRSTAIDAASITAAEWGTGALQSVGQIEDLMRDLSDRLAIYAAQQPELARSQAELLAIEMDRNMLPPLWDGLEGIDTSAKSIDEELRKVAVFFDNTPGLIESERTAIVAALQRELEAALANVDRQRVDTIAALSGEREAVFEDVSSLRAVLLEDVDRASDNATAEVEAIVERQARAFVIETESLIDMVFWRALVLLAIALVGLAVVLRIARAPKPA